MFQYFRPVQCLTHIRLESLKNHVRLLQVLHVHGLRRRQSRPYPLTGEEFKWEFFLKRTSQLTSSGKKSLKRTTQSKNCPQIDGGGRRQKINSSCLLRPFCQTFPEVLLKLWWFDLKPAASSVVDTCHPIRAVPPHRTNSHQDECVQSLSGQSMQIPM